ncbi:MAG: hypothetical protein WBP81_18020 [Solirubrobacteraceae bacterium]
MIATVEPEVGQSDDVRWDGLEASLVCVRVVGYERRDVETKRDAHLTERPLGKRLFAPALLLWIARSTTVTVRATLREPITTLGIQAWAHPRA